MANPDSPSFSKENSENSVSKENGKPSSKRSGAPPPRVSTRHLPSSERGYSEHGKGEERDSYAHTPDSLAAGR